MTSRSEFDLWEPHKCFYRRVMTVPRFTYADHWWLAFRCEICGVAQHRLIGPIA
jgi:hypothetical protein